MHSLVGKSSLVIHSASRFAINFETNAHNYSISIITQKIIMVSSH